MISTESWSYSASKPSGRTDQNRWRFRFRLDARRRRQRVHETLVARPVLSRLLRGPWMGRNQRPALMMLLDLQRRALYHPEPTQIQISHGDRSPLAAQSASLQQLFTTVGFPWKRFGNARDSASADRGRRRDERQYRARRLYHSDRPVRSVNTGRVHRTQFRHGNEGPQSAMKIESGRLLLADKRTAVFPSDSVQISWFHAKLNDLSRSSAAFASALLKQLENVTVHYFTSRKTRSTLFQFPCFSYLKSKPCRWQASLSSVALSMRNTASSTSCFSWSSLKNA